MSNNYPERAMKKREEKVSKMKKETGNRKERGTRGVALSLQCVSPRADV
jgi:hypothetical protein